MHWNYFTVSSDCSFFIVAARAESKMTLFAVPPLVVLDGRAPGVIVESSGNCDGERVDGKTSDAVEKVVAEHVGGGLCLVGR